jgi:hypothetical protein
VQIGTLRETGGKHSREERLLPQTKYRMVIRPVVECAKTRGLGNRGSGPIREQSLGFIDVLGTAGRSEERNLLLEPIICTA